MDNTKNPLAGAANLPAILTKRQAAVYLQTTTRYLERAVASGRLRALRPTGGMWRVRRKDIDAFLDSGATMEVKP